MDITEYRLEAMDLSSDETGLDVDTGSEAFRKLMNTKRKSILEPLMETVEGIQDTLIAATKKRRFQRTVVRVAGECIHGDAGYVSAVNVNSLLAAVLLSEDNPEQPEKVAAAGELLVQRTAELINLGAGRAASGVTDSRVVRNALKTVNASGINRYGLVLELLDTYARALCPKLKAGEQEMREWVKSKSTGKKAVLGTMAELFEIMGTGLGCLVSSSGAESAIRAIPVMKTWHEVSICMTFSEPITKNIICRCLELGGDMNRCRGNPVSGKSV